jgi:acyl phosphate:glycerol-3-phosphate acyltransferase
MTNMMVLPLVMAVLMAYGVGSLSSAVIVCQIMRLPDPRTHGSKNPGATNVLRLGGKRAAVMTLLGDVLKGWVPVMVAQWYAFDALGIALVALAAFLGHLFPLFFHFVGGKGVATLFGCVGGLSAGAGVCCIVTWLIVAVLFRYSSLAGMITALFAPLYIWFFTHDGFDVSVVMVMSGLLLYRHRYNVANLMRGKENKISGASSR